MRNPPIDKGLPPAPPALRVWPDAPREFTNLERAAWERLGAAVLPLGTLSAADVLVAERTAQVMARVDEVLSGRGEDLKTSTLNALVRLEVDMLKQLGLSPQARRQVTPLPKPKDDDDETSEFNRA